MDFATFLETLNIALGDTDDFTFTPEEKTRALTEAFNDPYVVTDDWDTSLTFVTGTYQYALPAGVTSVKDISIKADNSQDYPEKISSNLWEVVGTNIQFKPGADVIPSGYTLYVRGNDKTTIADTVSSVRLQEYILKLAQYACLSQLGNKRALRFLKNDTTMNELITLKRDLQQDVANYRRSLPTGYQVG